MTNQKVRYSRRWNVVGWLVWLAWVVTTQLTEDWMRRQENGNWLESGLFAAGATVLLWIITKTWRRVEDEPNED